MAEWVKAAEMQLELHRWLSSERGRHWCRSWTLASAGDDEQEKRDMYDLLLHAEPSKLLTADAIWVAPEMCEIIQVAKEGFQPEALQANDFITHTGFMYFAEPIHMLDRHKRVVSVGAVSWCPFVDESGTLQNDGMAITLYSAARSEQDEFSHMAREFAKSHGAPDLLPLHLSVISFGNPFDDGDLYDLDGNYTGADEWWRTVQVALRLMQQRVATYGDERLPRPTRRRMFRAEFPLDAVLVIRLRRPTPKHNGHEESETTVEWTHRWLVDGFWRNQPYGKRGEEPYYRQIWISPYVKGPEDLPLVVKKRYYKWDR